jgi:hypothetical protein
MDRNVGRPLSLALRSARLHSAFPAIVPGERRVCATIQTALNVRAWNDTRFIRILVRF